MVHWMALPTINDIYMSPQQNTINTEQSLGFLAGSIIPIGIFTPLYGTTAAQNTCPPHHWTTKWMEYSRRIFGGKKLHEIIIPGGSMSHTHVVESQSKTAGYFFMAQATDLNTQL